MSKHTLIGSLVLLIALVMLAVPAEAKDRHGGNREGVSEIRVHDRGWEILFPRILIGSNRLAHRPSGWDRGRKLGWGDCDLPPGLAKKRGGCRQGFYVGNHPRRRPGATIIIDIP